ncbi:MAG: 30S ribosomal protein S12 methylthiotransferase RimO [Eubacteriales bacterium]|nr:30S ribosomal protein S12 methylthiotransferase RimO [Eubacteriales bacterium]
MPRVHLISLGCDKNLADSEKTLGLLTDEGYEYTDDAAAADVIIVNTCCFIKDAKTESVETLIEMADLKSAKQARGFKVPVLVVMGCMAERYKDEITDTLPEVDVLVGTNSWQDIVRVIKEHGVSGEKTKEFRPVSENAFIGAPVNKRLITAGGHYSYLKIAEGCGKSCTYCIIPSLKGKFRSVPMEDLLEEARGLAEAGVKELILVAQETTIYGTDLYGRKMLPELLKSLNDIEGIEWIRLLYCYPEEITEELIQAIKTLPKVCHYIDMPIQHASDHILKRMARATGHDEIIGRIRHIREEIPDIVIRTTLISGFPGETDADHKILTEFVREMEFDRLGDFEYSREEGTKAAAYSHQVSAGNKRLRRDEIMSIQHDIAVKKAKDRVGNVYDVMIEGRLMDPDVFGGDAAGAEAANAEIAGGAAGRTENGGGSIYIGRTYMDAPDVDGFVYIDAGNREFMTGDIVKARVTAANEYDLIGVLE